MKALVPSLDPGALDERGPVPGVRDEVEPTPAPGRRTRSQKIQRRAATAAPAEVPAQIEAYLTWTRGGGRRLEGPLLQRMSDAFSHDFRHVGIHTDGAAADAARALGAQAFTFGADVYFAEGRFQPDTRAGQELLGHELAHVVQQGGAAAQVQTKLEIGGEGDAAEREADELGARAADLLDGGGGDAVIRERRPAISVSAPLIRRTPADVGFGERDYGIVGKVPGLIQSHIAQNIDVSASAGWDWIWRSRWVVYDASDQVVHQVSNWKHPDYTLSKETIKKGVPSDGGANQWTVRFETMESSKPFGGDSKGDYPWDQSRFHVYTSPIVSPKFTATPERGHQVVTSDSFTPAEDGASYSLSIAGTLVRTDDSSSTVTSSTKTKTSVTSSVGFSFGPVEGGLKNKVGFEASKQIAATKGIELTESQTESGNWKLDGLKKGKKYEFTVYPKFVVLTGSANVLQQNLGIVAGSDATTGSIRIWAGYDMVTKDNESHDNDNGEAKAPWERAKKQQQAVATLDTTVDRAARDLLIEEIRRQVPDTQYMEQVAKGARTALTLIIPGNGPLGIKTLNDDLVGYQINNAIIMPGRNRAVANAFAKGDNEKDGPMPFVVCDQTYKSTTVTSELPPAKLRASMARVLRAIDRDVKGVYLRGLKQGLTYWKAERDRTPEDTDEHREAERRVKNIEKAIAIVEAPDFQFDFQFGMAEIQQGTSGKTPDYAAAVEARMRSSQAALMSRDPEQPRKPGTDIGDRRGQIYDPATFQKFCEDGEALREKVIASGNTLTYRGHKYRVFVGKEANRDVIRDVRKGKVKEDDLASPAEKDALRYFTQYFVHINVFDNIRDFKSDEVAHVGEQIKKAQKLIDSLSGNGPVDKEAVVDALHQVPATGEVVPTTGTASEAVFYNAESARTQRIIVSCDIKDMGVDLAQHLGNAMYRVGKGHEPPDKVAQEASDPMVRFRRQAIQKVKARYTALVKLAIAAAEKRGDHELAKQLRAEREPSLLMGGDEITLSLHEGMRAYVGQMAAALMDPDISRARVAISTTGGDPAKAVDDHILAAQRADPAHSVLKEFEAAQRDLELTVQEITDPKKQKQGAEMVRALGINLLYAENEGKGIILHRVDTNAIVDADDLRRRIAETRKRLREMIDKP